jgi:hypothetical protein
MPVCSQGSQASSIASFEALQLSLLLVVHMQVGKTRSDRHRGVQDRSSCLVPLDRGIDRIGW